MHVWQLSNVHLFKKIKEALLLTGRKVMDENNINGKGMSIYVLEDLETIACIGLCNLYLFENIQRSFAADWT